MIQITTKQALLIAAAAVVAHPFLTNAVNNWGKYPSTRAALEACKQWAAKRGSVEGRNKFYTSYKQSIRKCMVRSGQGIVEGLEMKGVKDGQVFPKGDEPNRELAGKYWRF